MRSVSDKIVIKIVNNPFLKKINLKRIVAISTIVLAITPLSPIPLKDHPQIHTAGLVRYGAIGGYQ